MGIVAQTLVPSQIYQMERVAVMVLVEARHQGDPILLEHMGIE